MRGKSRYFIVVLVALLLLSLAVGMTACSSDDATETDTGGAIDASDDEGADGAAEPVDTRRQLVETKCSLCHTTERVWAADYNTEQWIGVIERMKKQGLVISIESEALILEYLTTQ